MGGNTGSEVSSNARKVADSVGTPDGWKSGTDLPDPEVRILTFRKHCPMLFSFSELWESFTKHSHF